MILQFRNLCGNFRALHSRRLELTKLFLELKHVCDGAIEFGFLCFDKLTTFAKHFISLDHFCSKLICLSRHNVQAFLELNFFKSSLLNQSFEHVALILHLVVSLFCASTFGSFFLETFLELTLNRLELVSSLFNLLGQAPGFLTSASRLSLSLLASRS